MWIDDLWLALRSVYRDPKFALIALVTMGLGIGAVTTVFSVFDSVLRRPLTFPSASELVWVGQINQRGIAAGPSFPVYDEWRDASRTLTGLALFHSQRETLTGGSTPSAVVAGLITPSFFSTLGLHPELGRSFIDADNRLGAAPVVILADSLWHSRYGADTAILGRLVTIDGVAAQVIGVMPPGRGLPGVHADLWQPIFPSLGFIATDPRSHLQGAVARLRPGATLPQARTELSALAQRVPPAGTSGAEWKADVVALREYVAGSARPVLRMVLGASILVLFVGCANVANLYLARGVARAPELALRRALGATPARLVRRLLLEAVIVAAGSAVLGVGLAVLGTRLVAHLGVNLLPRAMDIRIHADSLLVAVGLIALTGLTFGLVPALAGARTSPALALKAAGGNLSPGRASIRGRDALTIGEFAVTLVLLAGVGVLGRSVWAIMGRGPGMRTSNVLIATVMRPLGSWPDNKEPMREFGRGLVQRLEALPDVQAAAVSLLPPTSPLARVTVHPERPSGNQADSVRLSANVVTLDYFTTLGIALTRGRTFDARDREGSTPTVVLSQAAATRLFGRANPIGRQLTSSERDPRGTVTSHRYDVVGEVADVHGAGANAPPIAMSYLPFAQQPVPHMTVLVRARAPASVVAAELRRTVASLDAAQSIDNLSTLDRLLTASAARPEFYLAILAAFALTALVMAATGLYSVMLVMVRERTRELGVRIALGADDRSVLLLVMARAGRLVAIGVTIGLAGSYALTRLLRSLLSGVSPTDPTALAVASSVLILVALACAYRPARVALRIDPIAILRQ